MALELRSAILRYGSAVGATGLAFALRLLLDPYLGLRAPFVTFFVAVIFAAWYGGFGPSVLALALSTLVAVFWFVPPLGSLAVAGAPNWAAAGLFAIAATAVVVLTRVMRDAQMQAAAQREQLKTTLASIGDAVIATGLDGRVQFMNAVAESLTGWRLDDAAGHSLEDVFRIISEETRQPVESPVVKALREGRPVGLANHTLLIDRQGRERAIEDSAAPIRDEKGTVSGVVLVFRDDSEHRQAERRRAARVAITQTLAEDVSIEQASSRILQVICDGLQWDLGALWMVDRESHEIRCQDIHHRPSAQVQEFIARTRAASFRPGTSLPGRIWKGRKPLWIPDVVDDPNFVRADAAAADGLHGAFACPVAFKDEVLGVIEFFSHEIREPDADLLEMMSTLGGQLAQFLERRQAEQDLRRSEQELSDFFENAAVGLHWVGPDGTVLRVNQAELDMLGYSREEYVERNIAEFHADREVIDDILQRLARGETLRSYEARLRCKDGSIKHARIDTNVLWENGRFVHTRCFTRDITDQKRAEAVLKQNERRLRLALEAGRMGTWDWNLQTNEVTWSVNLEAIHGLPPGSFDGTFEGFRRLIHPDDRDRVQAAIGRSLEQRTDFEVEFRAVRPDGGVHWMLGKGNVFLDREGRPERMIGVGMDVTGRKELEQQLLRKAAQQTSLAELSQRALHESDQTALMDWAVALLSETLDVPLTGLLEFSADGESLLLRAGVGWREGTIGRARVPAERNFQAGGTPLEGRSAEPVIVHDLETETRFIDTSLLREHGAVSGMSILVEGEDRPHGILTAHAVERRKFTEVESRFLQSVANVLAAAIRRRRQEDSLRDAEARTRSVVDHVVDGIITVDARGRIQSYNPAAERIFGHTAGEMIGRNVRDLMPEPDRGAHDAYIANYLRTGEAKIIGIGREVAGLRRDGTTFPMDLAVSEFQLGGQRFFTGIVRDITERKRIEEGLRFLADASSALAALTDYESTLQNVASLAVPTFADWCAVDMGERDGNLRRLAVVHADPAKVHLAQELHARYPPAPDAAHGAVRVFRTGEPELVEEIPDSLLVEATRDARHLAVVRELGLRSYMGVPLRVRGEILGVITFVSAESGRRYSASDLAFAEELAHRAAVAIENARLYHEAREADRRKDEFLAMLAHELRNPLAPIRSGLDLLTLSGVGHESVGVMKEQVEHLVRLVDDLLDVSRIMRGKVQLRKEAVDLVAAAQRAVETVRDFLEQQRHELTVTVPETPLWVHADPVRLTQIITNLLNNSAKYTEPGGKIRLTVRREGEQAALAVRDNGIGIDAELLPRVFDLFAQADRTLERSQGGLGIGLTLVRALVEMHGGRVRVHSEGEGKGSEFEIRLPVTAYVEPAAAASRDTEPAAERRVLIVDDNAAAARLLKMLIHRLGDHEVELAYDGPSALEAARIQRPEIVLLDIGLPRMSGYDVAKQLRSAPENDGMLLVALTGYGTEEDRRRSLQAGFDEHRVKPLSFEQIKQLFRHPNLAGV